MARDERAFDEFVGARLPHLLRFGRAMTCDDAAAAHLVENALARVLARWDRSSAFTAEDDVRRAMVAHYLRDNDVPARDDGQVSHRDEEAWAAIRALSARQRTVVALRCHEDLIEGQVADVMRSSTGTVRGLAGQALAGLDEERIRRALDEPVDADETSLLSRARTEAARRGRRRTRWIAAVAALVVGSLAATGIVAAARTSSDDAVAGLPARAFAMAATAPDRLWAITEDPSCSRCARLWVGDGTPDGWKERYTFEHPALVAQLRMAPNGKDGWAWFGRDWLLQTHDGGKSWVVPGVDLRNANVDVQVAGSSAWVLLQTPEHLTLWRSEVGSDDWQMLTTRFAAASSYALVPFGASMLVVTYPSKGEATLAPASGEGSAHAIPCTAQPVPPAASKDALWVTCPDEGNGVAIKRSSDGSSWQDVALSPGTAAGSFPISEDATFVMASGGGRVVSDQGLTDVDMGLQNGESLEDGVFATPDIGFVITGSGRILRSDDGGLHWHEIG
jgi:DNA-directed RNA polymerase specialized sigma24 family protein